MKVLPLGFNTGRRFLRTGIHGARMPLHTGVVLMKNPLVTDGIGWKGQSKEKWNHRQEIDKLHRDRQ